MILDFFEKTKNISISSTSGPSPILMVPGEIREVKEVLEACKLYMLRLTPLGSYTEDDIRDFLDDNFKYWLKGREHSKKDVLHFHISIIDERSISEVRHICESFVRLKVSDKTRGFGLKNWKFEVAENPQQAIIYALKDGEFDCSKYINKEYVSEQYKKSFKKYTKDDFIIKLEKIKADFKINLSLSVGDFMISFVLLKAEYRQPIKMSYIYETALSCDINRRPYIAEQLVGEYIAKVNRFG